MSSAAALVGVAVGAAILIGAFILLICFCIHRKISISRNSEALSSEPSIRGNVELELSLQLARSFSIEELSVATKDFSNKSLIGGGLFGEVHMGLLNDGRLVAIKKRKEAPSQEFIDVVHYLSSIQHPNIVSLLGYCQGSGLQLLVYEYMPNGSISSHLFASSSKDSTEKLDFRLRLSIALGAAKGLAYLHALSPRLLHKNFKTANVLLHEDFTAKVADAGLFNFLARVHAAGSSSEVAVDEIFMAPEVREFQSYSEKADVYSFGVFLLELVTGREGMDSPSSNSSQNLVLWVQNIEDYDRLSSIIDPRFGGSYTAEGITEFLNLMRRCLSLSSEIRPLMSEVVMVLEHVLEKERSLTAILGESLPTVTPGSQLFEAKSK